MENNNKVAPKDYIGRKQTEQQELLNRMDKLVAMLYKAKHGLLDFELDCPVHIFDEQLEGMTIYARSLKKREKYE